MNRKMLYESIMEKGVFTATRSTGPGGQHVNKVNTRVQLRISIDALGGLTAAEKELLRLSPHSYVLSSGELLAAAGSTRSQAKNRAIVIDKLYAMVINSASPGKRRRRTAVPTASREKRIRDKQRAKRKKALRRDVTAEE